MTRERERINSVAFLHFFNHHQNHNLVWPPHPSTFLLFYFNHGLTTYPFLPPFHTHTRFQTKTRRTHAHLSLSLSLTLTGYHPSAASNGGPTLQSLEDLLSGNMSRSRLSFREEKVRKLSFVSLSSSSPFP